MLGKITDNNKIEDSFRQKFKQMTPFGKESIHSDNSDYEEKAPPTTYHKLSKLAPIPTRHISPLLGGENGKSPS